MENAVLGMRTLNISQGYYSNGTHRNLYQVDLAGEDTGIDTWRAKNHWKVLAILPYSTTGFANTVFFGSCDENGNKVEVMTPGYGTMVMTIAMTHDNVISSKIKVGAIFSGEDMIYEEGTTGHATGNHIHLEIAKGWVTSKRKFTGSQYYGGAQWCMAKTLPIEKCLFLLNGYNRVLNDNGYSFSWVDTIESDGKMKLNPELNHVSWNGNEIIVYKQTDDQDIGMISAAGGSTGLQTIDKINDDREHWCKVNANYFQMQHGQNDPYGQHYGVEQTPQLNLVPRQNKNYLVVWVDNDNKIHFDYSDNYWLSAPDDVKFACTPAAVMLADGIDQDIISNGLGDKRNTLNSQTMLLQLDDGKYAFACTTNDNWNAYNCRNFAKYLGATFCALMDSGGSTQMIVEGDKTLYTGRAIANALTFYKKGTGTNVWGSESTKPSEGTNTPSDENDELQALQKELESLKSEKVELESKNEELNNQLGLANGRIHNMQTVLETIHSLSEDAMSMNFKVYDDMAEALESLGIGKDEDKGE